MPGSGKRAHHDDPGDGVTDAAMRRPSKPTTNIGNAAANVNAAAVLPHAATSLDARMVRTGFDPATYRLNLHSLISSGRLTHAWALFDHMP